MSDPHENKKSLKNEDWSFKVDNQKVREIEREKEKRRKLEHKKIKSSPNKKMILNESNADVTGSRSSFAKDLEEAQDIECRKKALAREKATLSPYLKRLWSFLLDQLIMAIIILVIFNLGLTKLMLDQVKIYTEYDIVKMSNSFLDTRGERDNLYTNQNSERQVKLTVIESKEKLKRFGVYNIISSFICAILYFLLFIIPVIFWGKTPGKKILGIQIVRENGADLGPKAAFFRETFVKLFFSWGLITVFFTRKRQSLYDLICGSKVILYDDRLFNDAKVHRNN